MKGRTIVMTLKKEWFDKIRSGEKSVEYRERKLYWAKRLFGHPEPVTSIIFRNGYSSKSPTILAEVTEIAVIEDGRYTDLADPVPVYAIHLANIREIHP